MAASFRPSPSAGSRARSAPCSMGSGRGPPRASSPANWSRVRKRCRTRSSRAIASNSGKEIKKHVWMDQWYRDFNPDWSKVKTPMLSAGNWGGQGLHLRGNVEAFTQAASEQKWLEVHGLEHWTHFYTDYGTKLQKQFFDHFLKGADNGWDKSPRVRLNIRHVDSTFVERLENEWPLARTQWTKYYLDLNGKALSASPLKAEQKHQYDALGDGVTLYMPPFAETTEFTGPSAARLFISSTTDGRRSFPHRAAVRSAGGRGHVPRRARSEHADHARVAARVASQARSGEVPAVPALSYARPISAPYARRGLRTHDRDLADLHRRAQGIPDGADDPGQGLRVRRGSSARSPRPSTTRTAE